MDLGYTEHALRVANPLLGLNEAMGREPIEYIRANGDFDD